MTNIRNTAGFFGWYLRLLCADGSGYHTLLPGLGDVVLAGDGDGGDEEYGAINSALYC